MRSVRFEDDTLEHMSRWLMIDRKKLGRILKLIEETKRTPFDGTGKPEPLKGNLRGKWSRRIDDEHRMVYTVTDEEVIIHSLWGHYE
ncbi:MAG: Txe/YoeB family addiction module toxin [Spirosomaceae bacterium]|jgi:toxin YoeB|nr:Txe/YoeB family addiction module toxin [Spirosomataceae bacterium]